MGPVRPWASSWRTPGASPPPKPGTQARCFRIGVSRPAPRRNRGSRSRCLRRRVRSASRRSSSIVAPAPRPSRPTACPRTPTATSGSWRGLRCKSRIPRQGTLENPTVAAMPPSDLLREIRREGYTLGAIWRFARVSMARVSRGLPEHPELVRPIAATALGLFVLQFVAALLLSVHVGRSTGVTCLISSSVMLLFISFWVLIHAGLLLGSRDAQLVIRMPIPIAITMLRFVSIPAIVLLIHDGRWSAVVWLFAASAFTDVLDGVLARALHVETRVGALLDPLTDIVFNSAVFMALLEAGIVPWLVTSFVLVRHPPLIGGAVYLYFF